MPESMFPYSPFSPQPFQLRPRIDNVYHGLRRKFATLDDTGDWTFDDVIDDLADGIRQNQIHAHLFEEWIRFPSNEPPSSFNAFRIAIAFWLEAHYAEKAGDDAQGTAALFSAYFHLGMLETPRTIVEVAAKGGATTGDIYRQLAQAAIGSAEKLVIQGHKRDHQGVHLNTKGIIPLIAKDPAVIEANNSLGKNRVPDLNTTLTRWTRTDAGGRQPFRDAYRRLKYAWKELRKAAPKG